MRNVNEACGRLWSVVTSDYDKALTIMSSIANERGIPVRYRHVGRLRTDIVFEDDVWLRWIRPSDNARGYRHGKLWCDINVKKEILDCVILPKYFGKYEDIVWFQ